MLLFAYLAPCHGLRLAIPSEIGPHSAPFAPWRYCPVRGCAYSQPNTIQFYKKTDDEPHAKEDGKPYIEEPWASPNNCRLRNAFRGEGRSSPRFTFLGGSATAGAGLKPGQKTWAKHLEARIRQRMKDAVFHNAAQGCTETFWGANMLDSLVGDTDVLFWEYAINDVKGESTGKPRESRESMTEAMDFFVQKAMRLPSKPAPVFVYL